MSGAQDLLPASELQASGCSEAAADLNVATVKAGMVALLEIVNEALDGAAARAGRSTRLA